jgi:head-tail adaptor
MAGKATARLATMNVTVQVVRRRLVQPTLGRAEPKQQMTAVLTTRASVQTRSGSNEFARVDVNGVTATHTFTFRYSTIAIDTRDYLRDARGQLFKILSVENVDLQNRLYRLHCSNQGSEDTEAAR